MEKTLSATDAYYAAYYKKHRVHWHYYDDIDHRDQMALLSEHYSLDELRTNVCRNSLCAYWFSKFIDKEFHWETYQAVLGTDWESEYQSELMVA